MRKSKQSPLTSTVLAASILAVAGWSTSARAEWKPTKTVEFIVPAGTGGGADQMARMIQGIIQKHNVMAEALVVIYKGGGAGAEGLLDVKGSKGDPNKLIITLSNLFTTPLATGVPFKWTDMTPVAMLALDEFVLWVNAKSPYQSASDYISAIKAGGPNKMKMGGTGSKQEDQIITAAIEQTTGVKMTYVPYKGGGDVAAQLVGQHITSSVNNPIEAVAQWRAGELRPLCVFDTQRLPYKEPIANGKAWSDIPTCKEAGLDIGYLMLRGVFMPPGATQEQVDYYVGVLQKVRETPEWKDFMKTGAFNTSFMTGKQFEDWLKKAEETHRSLMEKAGFVAKS